MGMLLHVVWPTSPKQPAAARWPLRVACLHVGLGRIIRRFDRLLIIVAAVKAIKTSKFADTIRVFGLLRIIFGALANHPRSTLKAGSLDEMKAWSPPGPRASIRMSTMCWPNSTV